MVFCLSSRFCGSERFLGFGRNAIELAAMRMLGADVTGLIAGEEVNAEDESHDMLMTHGDPNSSLRESEWGSQESVWSSTRHI